MIKLSWLPNLRAYAVRLNGHNVGLVRFQYPFPFRLVAQFV